MSVWLWTFIVTKCLPQMYTSMGYGVYIFFASSLVCASIHAFFFIHETKGLRMDQMDHLFGFERARYEDDNNLNDETNDGDAMYEHEKEAIVDRKEVA
jgi:hypothetical protein